MAKDGKTEKPAQPAPTKVKVRQHTRVIPARPARTPEQIADEVNIGVGDSAYDNELDDEFEAVVTPSAPSAPPTSPPAAAPPHSALTVRMAKSLGLSDEYINSASAADLENEVYYRTRERLNLHEDFRRVQSLSSPQQPVQQPQAGEPPAEPDYDWGEHEGRKLAKTDYAKPIVDSVEGVRELKKELAELKEKLAHREQADRQRHAATEEELLDGAFEVLGAKYEKFFGKGRMAELPEGAGERKRRINALALAGVKLGEVPSSKQLHSKLQAAVDEIYGPAVVEPAAGAYAAEANEPAAPAADDIHQTLQKRREEWAGAALARPTNRAPKPEANGTHKAAKAVRNKLIELGVNGEDGIEEASLPD